MSCAPITFEFEIIWGEEDTSSFRAALPQCGREFRFSRRHRKDEIFRCNALNSGNVIFPIRLVGFIGVVVCRRGLHAWEKPSGTQFNHFDLQINELKGTKIGFGDVISYKNYYSCMYESITVHENNSGPLNITGTSLCDKSHRRGT